MMRDVAALAVIGSFLAVFGLSPDGAAAFFALCGPLFILFLMALLENAAARRGRWRRPPVAQRLGLWLRRTARAFLLASFTSAVSLILVQVSVALAAS